MHPRNKFLLTAILVLSLLVAGLLVVRLQQPSPGDSSKAVASKSGSLVVPGVKAPKPALAQAAVSNPATPSTPASSLAPMAAKSSSVKLPDPVYTSNDPTLGVSAFAQQMGRATELSCTEPVINPDGSASRVRILKDDTAKYPLLRVTETFHRRDDARFDPRATATVAVADHVLVSPVRKLSTAEADALAASLGGTVRQHSSLTGVLLIALPGEVPTADTVPDAAAALAANPLVRHAEADSIVYALGTVPNDPDFAKLYGLHNTGQTVNGVNGTADADMDVLEAWDATYGSASVIVAVIDTGVDWTHPDLAENIAINSGEIPGNGIDDDNNGFIDDVRGWDFYANDNNPMDEHLHGTHVAGTIAARRDNAVGVVGVAPQVKIVPLRFLGANGGGANSDAIESIAYANMRGIRLTNNSWGGGEASKTMQDVIEAGAAVPNGGAVFLAAAGNDGSTTPMYPAAYPSANILCVAASDASDVIASFSNRNGSSGWVDVAAPGVNIYSTSTGNSYRFLNGTSMATPNVAGVAALIVSIVPDLSAANIISWIKNTVDVKTGLANNVTTSGRVNANRAIFENLTTPLLSVVSTTFTDGGNANGVINPGEPVTLTAALRNVAPVAAAGVNATLTLATPDAYITLGTTTASPGAFAYLETKNLVFTLQVAANTPTPRVVNLRLTTVDSQARTRVTPITFTVYTQSTVTGTVRAFDGTPLAGARVASSGTSPTSTLTDAGGAYSLLLVDGSHELTASLAGHTPIGPRVVTVPPARSGVDFVLPRPNLVAGVANLAATVAPDGRATVTLPLTNDGSAPVTYTVRPMEYGAAQNGTPGGAPYNWIDITTTGTLVDTPTISFKQYSAFNCGPFPIGMDFPFYENSFRSFRLATQGWISFTSTSRKITEYVSDLPNALRPENMIAVNWVYNMNWFTDSWMGDYPANSRRLYYQQVDPQTFVITFQRWALLEEDIYTSQIILKRDGSIILQYGPFTYETGIGAPTTGLPPRIFVAGMQDATGKRGQAPVFGPNRIRPSEGTSVRMYPVIGAPWLATANAGATLPANGGQQNLSVTLDATGLVPGTYTTSLVLDSNDPDQPSLSLPVTFTVAAGQPVFTWVTPAPSASLTPGGSTVLDVLASGDLTGLTGVNFYDGDTLLGAGVLSGGHYTFTWTNIPAGAHALRAVATFGDGRKLATAVRATSGGSGFRVSIDALDYGTTTPAVSRNRALVAPFGIPTLNFNTLAQSPYARTVNITRNGTTASVTMPTGSNFYIGGSTVLPDPATFSGSSQPEYNGTKTVTWGGITQYGYTFPVTGTPANASATVADFGITLFEDNGATLRLAGEISRKFALGSTYTVTPNTVLEFDFIGNGSGYEAVFGIGLDNDNALSKNRIFQIWGDNTTWGAITAYRNYSEESDDKHTSRWRHYRIPVGQHFTGAMNFLTFVQVPSQWYYRHDGDSSYRNVRLYEDTAATTDYAFAWNFNDSPATPVGEEIYRTWHTAGDKTVTVTATRSGQTATASRAVTITGSGVFAARINFQPATAPVPFGFVPDTGAVYADRGNGYTYGWNTPNTSGVDAEFFVHSRSQERDTTIRQTTTQVWELAVPNGTYNVYLSFGFAGDTGNATSNNNLKIEGQSLVDLSLAENFFSDTTGKFIVTDGKLTLTSHSNSAALCYIEVTRLDTVLSLPVAAFSASSVTAPAPASITFDASASYSNVGTITGYAWDFGDGTTGTGVTPAHTFTAPGLRVITLTVTDSAGATATSSTAINVAGAPLVATSLSITPASASVSAGGSRTFTAVVKDQYDLPLSPQPAVTWQVSGGGSISGAGVFTASLTPGGPYTVTATSGEVSNTATLSVVTPVATSVLVTPSSTAIPVTMTQAFSASVLDQVGQPMNPQPTVSWQVSGGGSISSGGLFTAGGTAGGPFTVTATSGSASGTAQITVTSAEPVATTIVVTPANPSVATSATRQFSAVVNDQNGTPLASQPLISWSVSGGGTINSLNGLFTAGSTAGGPFTVTAASGSLVGTTTVTVTEVPATSVFAAHFNNGTGSGGDDLAGLYNWNGAIGTAGALVTTIGHVAVSQGATDTAGVPLVSGQSTSGGFLFALPAANNAGVSLLHSTSLTTSDSLQDNPQTHWFRAGGDALSGLRVGDIARLSVFTRPATTATTMRFALRVGDNWFVSTTAFNQSNINVYEKRVLADLTAANAWYSGVFTSGSSLDANLGDNPMVTLNANDAVTGYGWYADTDAQSAADSRVRIDSFVIHANVVANTAPTISAVANQSIAANAATSALDLTVGDTETAVGSLTLSATSSNLTLVPSGNIVFGGSGANRTVTVTPAANQTGSSTITVTVSDGSLTASSTFTLTVTPNFSSWISGYPGVGGPADDPDADGLTNLLEYALGSNPNSGTPAPTPQIANSKLQINFTRSTAATDLVLVVKASSDLVTWTDIARSQAGAAFAPLVGGVTVNESGSGSLRNVEVIDSESLQTAPRRFLRLKVELGQ
jgi:subtilisin family serine protease/PKD repeat protein